MKYLLDTDHISFLQRPTSTEYARLVVRLGQHGKSEYGSSVITFHEQALGAHTLLTRARTTPEIVRAYTFFFEVVETFQAIQVVPFDLAAAAVFDALRGQRLRVATADLRIASIALSRGLTVLTRNAADFGRVPGVVTEDWTM